MPIVGHFSNTVNSLVLNLVIGEFVFFYLENVSLHWNVTI